MVLHAFTHEARILVVGGSGFIGCNLVKRLQELATATLNLDLKPPLNSDLLPAWMQCDVRDPQACKEAISSFEPTHIVHLAARTDTGNGPRYRLEGYDVNIRGLANVISAIVEAQTVKRLVFTSTQFVVGPKSTLNPLCHRRYDPFTTYGHSKAMAEELLWTDRPTCDWIIVRPTTVWGPWSFRHVVGFFRALKGGYYVHPDTPVVLRAYGYVENVCEQIAALLIRQDLPEENRVYYVGDRPLDLRAWVDAFSMELTGRRARRVHKSVVKALATVGEAMDRVGLSAPINWQRFESMTVDYTAPMQPTLDLLRVREHPLEYGVKRTVEWALSTGLLSRSST